MNKHYHFNSKREAFAAVQKQWIFMDGIYLHDEKTERAGYPIYKNVYDDPDYICDLGDRLEVNFFSGHTVNFWYK